MAELDDVALLRHSRQLLLPQIGVEGQQRILDARVLVLGLGGLGSSAALYLVSAGVGQLVLADFDRVDSSNLQRQIAHTEADIGEYKVLSAARSLAARNSKCRILPLAQRFDAEQLLERVAEVDLVVDCSDNFATRYAVNAACVRAKRPLVSAAAIRFEGQIGVFDARTGPCYQCLFPLPESGDAAAEEPGDGETCADNGVFAPLVGVMGCLQASEALKLLGGFGQPLTGRLLLHDALQGSWRELRLHRDPACPICAGSD